MRKILIILLCAVGITVNAQTVLTIQGIDTTVVTNQGYDVPRSSVTTLTISKNRFSSGLNANFILQAGEDTYNASTDNNLDGGVISGNYIEWTGMGSYPASLMHGIMAGYQKNYTIKHNYFDKAPYSVVYKSGNNEPMTYTSGGHSYNIHYNSRALYTKGMSGIRIYNNTFYNSIHDYSVSPAIYITENDGSEQSAPYTQATGTDIKNNIFYRKYNRSFITMVGADVTDDFECDYNIYWCENSTNNEPRFVINGTGYTWTQWRALGYDAHSYVMNPNFIDTVNFIPSEVLGYGVDLGEDFDAGLSTDAEWSVGLYPDTVEQNGTWQVGAVLYDYYEADYYVAPDGNDTNPGTFAEPWATLQHAMSNVSAGDTVYLRGGNYAVTSSQSITSNPGLVGTEANPICFFAYPGETPVINGSTKTSQSHGITLYYSSWVKFRGIVVANHEQFSSSSFPSGWNIYYCTDLTFDNCTVHDIGGRGFAFRWCDRMTLLNCDAYNCNNDVSTSAGGDGDGFFMSPSYHNFTGQHYFYGCRAWRCSDDGWDVENLGLTVIENCWSFNNGYEEYADAGLGNGFKLGLTPGEDISQLSRLIKNCVAIYNRRTGFTTNDNGSGARWMHVYNNTAYANGLYGEAGYGFQVYATGSSDAAEQYRIFRNNIAYANTTLQMRLASGAAYTSEYNTWDGGVTVTDGDFVSIDTTGITAARQSDGSLPNNDCFNQFLRLAAGSDLIDSGTDVELDYDGVAPDLGAFESTASEVDSTATDITGFVLDEQQEAAVINSTAHTISVVVDPGTVVTALSPTITLDYGATVDPASHEPVDFNLPVTYTVTALDGTTTQEWVVTVTIAVAPSASATFATKGGVMLKKGTRLLIID